MTFYRFLEALQNKGIEGLTPQYSQNGRKPFTEVTQAEKEFLRQYLLQQNSPKIADGIRKCKHYLGEHSPSSPATLRRYINQFKKEFHDVWTLDREGHKAWHDKCAPYQSRAWWALDVGEILVADGHALNFQVINPHTGKPCRAVLIMFWDWHSSYPVGWEVMLTENVQCVTTALRNSILTLGKIPKCVYLDNGKAFRASCFTREINFEETQIPGMFARLDIDVVFASPYNAQAKPVERIFHILEWLERQVPSFVGASTNDKPAYMRPNEDRAKKLRGEWTPKLEEVNSLIHQWRDFYVVQPLRGRRNKTAKEVFDPGRGQGIDPLALCFLMMSAEVKSIRRNRLTFHGFDWTGDCLYGLTGKVIVRYSLSDMSKVYVFDPNDRFIGMIEPVEATAPRDYVAAKKITSERRRLLRETKKLSEMARAASPEVIDLVSRKNPELLEYIRSEEEKKPGGKFISPFPDDWIPETPIQTEEKKIDMAAACGSPLSSPFFREVYEQFEWYLKRDPEGLNLADLGWIAEKLDDHEFCRSFGYETARLARLRSKRPAKVAQSEGETASISNDDGQEKKEDGASDEALENRWHQIRSGLVINPDTGLSETTSDAKVLTECEWVRYMFCREIEKRFPGTLSDADRKWVEKYEAGKDWEFFFSETYKYNRLIKMRLTEREER